MLWVRADGRVIGGNDALTALLGIAADDLAMRSLDDIVADARDVVVALLGSCVEQGASLGRLTLLVEGLPVEFECFAARLGAEPDGSGYTVVLRCAPASSQQFALFEQQLAALRAEVDDRRRLQGALEVAEAAARAVVDTAVDAIITIDAQGIMHSANAAACSMFGYRPEELLGRNVKMLMPEPYRAQHDDFVLRYLETGIKRIIGIGREVVAKRRDGSRVPVELAVGEFSVNGERRFTGLLRDISDRKRMEEQLRQREETLRVTLEQAPTGIITMDLDGGIVSVNRAFCRILGREQDDLIGSRFRELCHADDALACDTAMERLLRGGAPSVDFESRLKAANDASVFARMFVAAVRDASGRACNLIAQVVDRSEEVRHAEEAREHRERLAHAARVMTMGEMAAGIAHEINQPLAAIASYAHACRRMLESGEFDDPDLLEALHEVGSQAERAGEVIRRLRAMVKTGEERREVADLNEVVAEAVRLATIDVRAFDGRIDLELSAGLSPVKIDVIQVQQVLLNLVRNAIDAMSDVDVPDKRVLVRTRAAEGETVVVDVVDEGKGLSEEVAEKLFRPFFTTKGSGMGMGLSISRSIITAHGGRLWFTHGPHAGATFHFSLPTIVEERHAASG